LFHEEVQIVDLQEFSMLG